MRILSIGRSLAHPAIDNHSVFNAPAWNDYEAVVVDPGGVFQAVLDFMTKPAQETQLLRAMAERCGDVLFSGGVGNGEGRSSLYFYRDRKSTRLNSSHVSESRMPSSA